MRGKPSIVFAHGLWADASCFSKVIELLVADGFEVIATQNHLNTVADDAAAVRTSLGRARGPVVLVGHSYGGTVITAAGTDDRAHRPDAVPGSRLQRVRGTVCPLHQRRMSRSARDPRGGAPAPDAARIHGALSPGTESSRFTGSLDRPRADAATGRRGPLPPAARRSPQFLRTDADRHRATIIVMSSYCS